MTHSCPPLVPRDTETTRALVDANKRPVMTMVRRNSGGTRIPAIAASKNPRNKQRPITLAERA